MKLNSIQYLRGLAALLVVMAHAADHPLADTPPLLGNLGELGVTLFFVISGFIMVAITGPGSFAAGAFLKRRIVRVVPLYWVFTTLAAVSALALPAMFKSTVFTWSHFTQSLLFIPHEAPVKGGYSPILALGWTLNYEIFFYLVFALCAALRALPRVALITAAFVALSVVGQVAQPTNIVWSFYANQSLLGFCAGAWVGLAFSTGWLPRLPAAMATLLALVGLVLLGFGLTGSGTATYYILLAGSALLVIGAVRLESALPRVAFLGRVGDASYSMYLVHMFVVGTAVVVTAKLLPFDDLVEYLLVVGVAVVASVIAGLLVHRFIEQPLLRLFGVRLGGIKASRVEPAVVAAE